ncbi:hypothetical protein FACS1894132_01040 [Clostridia bacterium]|nr:hypothetical protein FACS1894132_01040 [Clostridia bacterium]
MRKIELRKIKLLEVSRTLLYLLLAIFAYALQTLDIDIVKPLPLIPIAIIYAINEDGEFRAVGGGVVCGLMLDNSLNTFFGYSAFFLVIFSVFSSLLFFYLLRPNVGSVFLVTMVYSFIFCFLHYFFYYFIWRYDESKIIFKEYVLPSFCYTAISTIAVYPIMRLINRIRLKGDITIKEMIR